MFVTTPAPGRFRHVFLHYLPMMFIAVLFLFVGLVTDPKIGRAHIGIIFDLIGVILLIGAVLGMMFTRCEKDYITWRVMCFREPDVRASPSGEYYRDLVPDEPSAE